MRGYHRSPLFYHFGLVPLATVPEQTCQNIFILCAYHLPINNSLPNRIGREPLCLGNTGGDFMATEAKVIK